MSELTKEWVDVELAMCEAILAKHVNTTAHTITDRDLRLRAELCRHWLATQTTPPAHAAQTVDVSRAAVNELCAHLDSVAWRPDSNGDPECFDEGQARAADMLRALLDAKEKAEQDNARLRRVVNSIAACEANTFCETCRSIAQSAARKHGTGNDDTGGTRT